MAKKIIHAKGKRKRAVARATLKEGKGTVRINGRLLDSFEPELARMKIREPILLSEDTINKINISVKVFGGGIMAQADAIRLAIGRSLVQYNKKLEKPFLKYDRQLLVADIRRKETHKPNSHGKARAKRQKSYR